MPYVRYNHLIIADSSRNEFAYLDSAGSIFFKIAQVNKLCRYTDIVCSWLQKLMTTKHPYDYPSRPCL